MVLYSCQGEKEDLDGPLSDLPRTRDLTESLIANYRVGALWDNFGIVSDVVVSTILAGDFNWTSTDHRLLNTSHSQTILNAQISMSL